MAKTNTLLHEYKYTPRKCDVCGAEFQPVHPAHKLCSDACKAIRKKEYDQKRNKGRKRKYNPATYLRKPENEPKKPPEKRPRWTGAALAQPFVNRMYRY